MQSINEIHKKIDPRTIYSAKHMITQSFNKLHSYSALECLELLRGIHAMKVKDPRHATWPKKLRDDGGNRDALLKVCANFTQDRKMLALYNMKPNKGLLLTGATGVGKTHIMKLVWYSLKHYTELNPFVYELEVADSMLADYEQDADGAVKRFSYPRTPGGKLMDFCIDDILSEPPAKCYGGPEVRYIAKVIMNRYTLFTDRSIFTHFTTNGRSPELLEAYGDKALDRLREMCNIVVFPPDATNWRTFDHDVD